LAGSKEWEALREYLGFRSRQLFDTFILQADARDRDEIVAKMAIMAKGGVMELTYLLNLPILAKEIVEADIKRASALRK
jgi:hypothetical protein